MESNFFGQDGFLWFVGVVEDRQDPQKLGRVRVRALGYHIEDKNILPTSDLPWASPLLPITSSGVSGIGQSPLGLVEGSWVVGFWRDGLASNEGVIMGSLTGRPVLTGAEAAADNNGVYGFRDPNGIYPRYKNESDVNRLARNDTTIPLVEFRKLLRYTVIPTANILAIPTADLDSTAASEGDTWNQPENPYNATYPYNHTFESEGGHIREYDDTPDNKRILEYHVSGTEYEISNDGTRNTIIKGSDYRIVEKDDKIYIKGDSDITLGGRHKILINADGQTGNNYDIQIGPNANVNIQVDNGDVNITTLTGNMNMYAGENFNLAVGGTYTLAANKIVETSATTTTRSAQGEYHTYGAPIDHN